MRGIGSEMASSFPARNDLEGAAPGGTPKSAIAVQKCENHIIANNSRRRVAVEKAQELGFNVFSELRLKAGTGLGRFFSAVAREIERSGNDQTTRVPPQKRQSPCAERMAAVKMALAWAMAMAWRFLSAAACFASVARRRHGRFSTAQAGIVDFTCARSQLD
jgi:hypothetical protein